MARARIRPWPILVAGAVMALAPALSGAAVVSPDTSGTGRSTLPADSTAAPAPDRVTIQHLLLVFDGSIPYRRIARTKATADSLAPRLHQLALSGADFDSLVKVWSDDRYPGRITLTNRRVRPGPGERPRNSVEPAVGNLGFSLRVGEIGLAPYDARSCPYGWQIVKRLK